MSPTRPGKAPWIVLSLLLALAVLSLAPQPAAPVSGGNAIALKAPSFLQVANAQEGTSAQEGTGAQDAPAAAPMGFPQDEAGIAAYFKSASPVNLADVRGVFRVIEVQTADYIIGSVPVAGYPESEDVHLYVHRDGWFLAYYLSADSAGKIFDWRKYHDTGRIAITTKLENALAVVASQVGVAFSSATYYDFRYPNATHMMFVVEWVYGGTDVFEIKLTGTYAYYERSWSLGCDGDGVLSLNGTTISDMRGAAWKTSQGYLTAAQLLPDQFHRFGVYGYWSGYGGLVLIYRVP